MDAQRRAPDAAPVVPGRAATARPGRSWAPAGVSISVAGLWLSLSLWHPDMTYHGGPALVALAWPWAARHVGREAPGPSHARRPWTPPGPVVRGVALSLAGTATLSWAGALQGPTVVHHGSAAVEAVLAALLAGLYGVAGAAWRRSRPGP